MPAQQSSGLDAAVDIEFTQADLAEEIKSTPSSVGPVKVQPVAVTPFGRKVIDKLNERNERPDVRLQAMVSEAREKLAELDEQREKLEAFREVQIGEETGQHRSVQGQQLKSIEHYETQIVALRQALEQGDIDHRAKLAEINANVDAQVGAIDTMENIHRNVINSAPPKSKRRKKDIDDLPF